MANLDSILKRRDITLPAKVRIVKAMVFPVAMYGCESCTIRKAERRRIDAFELWCWRRLLRVPWTARRSNQSVLEEINPDCSLEGQILKMKLKYFGHLMRRKDSLEKSLMLGTIDGKRRRVRQRMRWIDGVNEAVGVSLSGLWGMVEDRKAWRNIVHGVAMGNKFWVFKDTTLQPGYPHDLITLGNGIPAQGIDSAIWWEDVGKTYFFKGDRYWRYSEDMRTMDAGYPKPITIWKGIPESPQGAFVHKENGFTYFYKGKEYWKFNNQMLRVEPAYPRSILKDFMGCDGPADRDKDRHSPQDDVDIVIKLDNTASTVKAIAIVIPCILALCLLVLVYTVFQFKRKGTPRHILYCKRSMQEWV
ncbi:Matrix metalloproteinase-16 [Varanus komodoensis]|nr:Matrix metalloproteinase-16 [Varanus komodoensis]